MLKGLFQKYVLGQDDSKIQDSQEQPRHKTWLDVIDGRKIYHGCLAEIDESRSCDPSIKKLHYFMLYADNEKKSVTIKLLTEDARDIDFMGDVFSLDAGNKEYTRLSNAIHSGRYYIRELNGSLRIEIVDHI